MAEDGKKPVKQPIEIALQFKLDEANLEKANLAGADEASLLWDEYRYRHDLIWQHLIRSTLALVALVTVRYAEAFSKYSKLAVIAFFAALAYWLITALVIHRELRLFLPIKAWHRYRQHHYLNLHQHDQTACQMPDAEPVDQYSVRIYLEEGFARRVGCYLLLLFLGIILMIPPQLVNLPSH